MVRCTSGSCPSASVSRPESSRRSTVSWGSVPSAVASTPGAASRRTGSGTSAMSLRRDGRSLRSTSMATRAVMR